MSTDKTDAINLSTRRITARTRSRTKSVITVRDHEFVIDEPLGAGGTDDGPTPMETFLGAQAGCLSVIGNKVADDMDVDVTIREIDIDGWFDKAKLTGQSDDPRAGFQEISVNMRISTDEDESVIREWAELTEERCPVTDNIIAPTPSEITIAVFDDQ